MYSSKEDENDERYLDFFFLQHYYPHLGAVMAERHLERIKEIDRFASYSRSLWNRTRPGQRDYFSELSSNLRRTPRLTVPANYVISQLDVRYCIIRRLFVHLRWLKCLCTRYYVTFNSIEIGRWFPSGFGGARLQLNPSNSSGCKPRLIATPKPSLGNTIRWFFPFRLVRPWKFSIIFVCFHWYTEKLAMSQFDLHCAVRHLFGAINWRVRITDEGTICSS